MVVMKGRKLRFSLSSGGYELVYHKRWLRQPRTTLEVKAPRPESLVGREAHDRMKAILAETLDDELWRALRIEQGTELILPNFGLPSMGRASDRAAGGDLATEREETLWTRIGEEHDKYWTPTGQVRTGRRSSEQGVQEARVRVAELAKQLQDIESDAVLMSWLMDESTRLSETIGSVRNVNGKSNSAGTQLTACAVRWNALMPFTVPRRRSGTVLSTSGSAAKR